jgi:hypothetical protein
MTSSPYDPKCQETIRESDLDDFSEEAINRELDLANVPLNQEGLEAPQSPPWIDTRKRKRPVDDDIEKEERWFRAWKGEVKQSGALNRLSYSQKMYDAVLDEARKQCILEKVSGRAMALRLSWLKHSMNAANRLFDTRLDEFIDELDFETFDGEEDSGYYGEAE